MNAFHINDRIANRLEESNRTGSKDCTLAVKKVALLSQPTGGII